MILLYAQALDLSANNDYDCPLHEGGLTVQHATLLNIF